MSGFPTQPATSVSNVFNPSFYQSSSNTSSVLIGITKGTATASKALVLDSSKGITGIGDLSCSSLTTTQITGKATLDTTPNMYLRTNGSTLFGSTSAISNNSEVEIRGAVLISDEPNTVAPPSTDPSLSIYLSTQSTGITQPHLTFGRSRSGKSDYLIGSYYASLNNDYSSMLIQGRGSAGGLTVNQYGNVYIAGRNNITIGSGAFAALEVAGYEGGVTVHAGYGYTSGGQSAVGGGSVPICARFTNNCWITGGTLYVTSDGRLKKNIDIGR